MKTTGMIRRIDELGRLVIPKEIRKSMRLLEVENVEIFVQGDQLILKKYSLVKRISDFAQYFTDSIYSFLKENIIITDTDSVIAASGPYKKEFLNQYLSDAMLTSIKRHENILEKHKKILEIVSNKKIEEKVANIAAEFFMKYLEE